MSSLTSTQINNTYPSLLKLSTSTTGITSTLQSVEDGLGGDTGLKIKQDYIGGSSLVPFPKKDTTEMAYGIGVINAGSAFPAGSHNLVCAQGFYDRGLTTYSAITYGIGTVSTTSDVVEIGIYSSQITPQGIMPKDLLGSTFIISGSEVTTTGLAKKTLPSNITLEEGGCYYILYNATNASGATPTVRIASGTSGQAKLQSDIISIMNGYIVASPGTFYVNYQKGSSTSTSGTFISTISGPLSSSYVPATWVGAISLTAMPQFGFVLHPVN